MGLLDRPPSSRSQRVKQVLSTLFSDSAFVFGLLYIVVIFIVAATIAGSVGASKAGSTSQPCAPAVEPVTTPATQPQPVSETRTKSTQQKTARPSPSHTPLAGPSLKFLYRATALHAHNQGRAQHGSPPLVWNDTLEETAALVSQSCEMVHQMGVLGIDYGQNLAGNNGPFADFDLAGTITGSWYDEERFFPEYGVDSPGDSSFEQWGHFTQLVWRSTTSVGCITKDCTNVNPDMTAYLVCNYYPAGNVFGDFGENVLPKRTST